MRLVCLSVFFFLMIRRPPRSTLDRSSAASDVYKRQAETAMASGDDGIQERAMRKYARLDAEFNAQGGYLSLIHISEPTRPY